jgi:catechol 2,3-dioxygenase
MIGGVGLPAATHMGAVHVTVSDLERSLGYYTEQIGLRVLKQEAGSAELGSDRTLLVLTEQPGARPADGYSGLFHFALLVPSRPDLARWLAHAARDRVALQGLSDHSVSEAIYLRDPDHHGIEIYADRPREQWEGEVAERMTTLPLNVDDLFTELDDPATESFDGLPGGTVMGHVHFCVADVEAAVEFYRDTIGFDLMARYGAEAAFLSAGGYHHHVGVNTWQSLGAPYAPDDRARLIRATIEVPDAAGAELHDPSGIPLILANSTDR